MPKVKKSPKIKYGIEITKPHSKEMYDHNDMVNSLMKKNILESWKNELDKLGDDDRYIMDRDWDEDDLKRDCPNIVNFKKVFVGQVMVQDIPFKMLMMNLKKN